jgi:SAM-dependent methyltransferase
MGDDLRKSVEEFYKAAVVDPREDLCCPVKTPEEHEMVSHIPEDILSISYGCGSPALNADISEGKTVVDLGSGGGIDCFIAARIVGAKGSVIGVDMTEEMLGKAKTAKEKVASNLGYDVVEFRHGYLEKLPLDDLSTDIVISNCVINLSPDKPKVFAEIYRALKDRGHFSISDVVSHGDVPKNMQEDTELWGECISGALKEEEFISMCVDAGFYGVHVTSRTPYRDVDGLKFSSIVIHGYKFQASKDCDYQGHYAIYNGPLASVKDCDGHEFAAGMAVEVCIDTREKLDLPPYRGLFSFIDPDGELVENKTSCAPSEKSGSNKNENGCC